MCRVTTKVMKPQKHSSLGKKTVPRQINHGTVKVEILNPTAVRYKRKISENIFRSITLEKFPLKDHLKYCSEPIRPVQIYRMDPYGSNRRIVSGATTDSGSASTVPVLSPPIFVSENITSNSSEILEEHESSTMNESPVLDRSLHSGIDLYSDSVDD